MGPYVFCLAALFGFYAFACVYYFTHAVSIRKDFLNYGLGIECFLRAITCVFFSTLFQSADPDFSNRVYRFQFTLMLLTSLIFLWNVALFTRHSSKKFLWSTTIVIGGLCLSHSLIYPLTPSIIQVDSVALPWGENLLLSVFSNDAPLFLPLSFAILLFYLYAIYRAISHAKRNRTEGLLLFCVFLLQALVATSEIFQFWQTTRIPVISGMAGGFFWILMNAVVIARRQRNSQNQLRSSEQRFRELADAIPQIVWLADASGGLTHLNARAVEYTNIDANDLTGWSWEKVIHPDDLPRVVADWTQILTTQKPRMLEFRIRHHSGEYRWHVTRQVPSFDSQGRLVTWYGTCTDVQDLFSVREALEESQRFKQLITQLVPSILYVLEIRRIEFLYLNPATQRLLGYSKTELITQLNQGLPSIMHPEDSQFWGAHLRQLAILKDGDSCHFDYRLKHADGSWRWFSSCVTVFLRDSSGNVTQVIGVATDITESRRAQDALQTSEATLRLFVEHVPAPIAMFDREMNYIHVSKQWYTDYVLKEDQVLGKNHYDVFPNLPARWKEVHQRCLAGAVERCDEDFIQRDDGTPQWIRWETRPWYEHSGQIGGLLIFSENITEKKLTAKLVKETEDRYRTLIHFLPEAILLCIDEKIVYCNPAAEKLLCSTPEHELIGCSYLELFLPEERERKKKNFLEMLATKRPILGRENKILRLDGTSFPAQKFATPIVDGTKEAVLICFHDLSELQRSSRVLRSILASVGDAILTIDAKGTIILANEATTQIFGYEVDDIVGKNINVLMPEPHRTSHDGYLSNYLLTGDAKVIGVGRELQGLKADGTLVPVELAVTQLMLDDKPYFTGVLRDITVRKRLESQFQQSQKMEAVGRLAGGIAHDFNNLLTIINGYSDMLLMELPSESEMIESVASIRDAGDRAARLTQQLLAFSRKAIVEPKLLDLNELLSESVRMLRRLIGEDIDLTVLLDPNLPWILADTGQIEQVVMNLLVNARDAMPTGGKLRIETRKLNIPQGKQGSTAGFKPGQYACVAISDTGQGMTDEVKSRIFEPFFTTKGVGKGTGLGLAVVHGVVEQCGGSITVDSTVGVGTKFSIYFPAAPQETVEQAVGKIQASTRGTETILLVEDDQSVRKIVRLSLEMQGYKVIEASNGRDAISLVEADTHKIDLLLTDVVMPEMSGRIVAETLRVSQPRMRVLFMSGYTDDAIFLHGVAQATDTFIHKPFTPLCLARKVRWVLDSTPAS